VSTEEARLVALKQRAAARLMELPGVTAVGLGGRERTGEPTGEIVLKGVRRAQPAARRTDGGARVEAKIAGSGPGTLGCLLQHTTDPARVYALTNFRVLPENANGFAPVPGSTRMGHPVQTTEIFKCCSRIFGTFVAGNSDADRDAAVIQLDPGTKWLAEILGLGPCTGRARSQWPRWPPGTSECDARTTPATADHATDERDERSPMSPRTPRTWPDITPHSKATE
jgi:hypothetical protein